MNNTKERIRPVVMCGGAGTRLWPVSRESMPKQFIPLIGELSTFQTTMKRVSNDAVFSKPCVITNEDFRFIVAEQLRTIGVAADIVVEPERRDSGPAVAVAAVLEAKRDPKGIVLILASDHVIDGDEAFWAACLQASHAAREGFIMTLGIKPTEPATGYGYIHAGKAIGAGPAKRISSFVEKPDEATAARYVSEGYLWNSGNFLFRADVMLDEITRFEPAIREGAEEATLGAKADLDFLRLDATGFAKAPKKSIDYAVMERTSKAGVMPVSFGWSDLGAWDAVWAIGDADARGNVTRGPVELLETDDSLVHSDGTLTAVLGLKNVVVVSTRDAVFVGHRSETAKMKTLVDQLKTSGHKEATEHLRMHRPWGWYQRVDIGPRFQVKRIMVKPGSKLSLQKHHHRAEHWVVVQGTAEVTCDGAISLLRENEAIYLPLGCVHRLANPGLIPLEIIEVQVGSYTGEDDIVRIEDVYNR